SPTRWPRRRGGARRSTGSRSAGWPNSAAATRSSAASSGEPRRRSRSAELGEVLRTERAHGGPQEEPLLLGVELRVLAEPSGHVDHLLTAVEASARLRGRGHGVDPLRQCHVLLFEKSGEVTGTGDVGRRGRLGGGLLLRWRLGRIPHRLGCGLTCRRRRDRGAGLLGALLGERLTAGGRRGLRRL